MYPFIPKFCKPQTQTDTKNITVPDFIKKSLVLFFNTYNTSFILGRRSGGISSKNPELLPFIDSILLKILPDIIVTITEIKYIAVDISGLPLKNLIENHEKTAHFAPHGINGARKVVILRSLLFSIVLVAIIPVTVQPHDKTSGITDFPPRPIPLNTLSVMKDTLAIYPLSSKRVKSINRTSICGKKDITVPTPLITALLKKLIRYSGTPLLYKNTPRLFAISLNPLDITPLKNPPMPLESKYTVNITAINIIGPTNLPINSLSTLLSFIGALGIESTLFIMFSIIE